MANDLMVKDPELYNVDLAPIAKEKRRWTWVNYSTIWMGMVHNIVAYETAAALLSQGFSVAQALLAVIIANAILVLAMWLNGVAGAKYGLPFPVLIRSAFGYKGAQIPVLLRAFVAIFWFAVQSYAGSLAINALFGLLIPGWNSLSQYAFLGLQANVAIAFGLFWILHALVISHGMERIRHFELWAGPMVIIMGLIAVVWAVNAAHGLGPLFTEPSHLSPAAFDAAFPLAVTGLIGVWATLVLNIPDFTRFAKSQRDQVVGQAIGLPITAILFALISIITTSGALAAFGSAISNPVDLLQRFHNPLILVFGALTLIVATLSVNVGANVVSPAYDLVNLFPRKLHFVSAGILAIALGVLFVPWMWFNNATTIYDVLGAIGGALGPVAGLMLADFYVVRNQHYDVEQFFERSGDFRYQNGWNLRGLMAFGVGLLGAFIGLFIPSLHVLYTYSWFVGIVASFVSYALLMRPYVVATVIPEPQEAEL
ncbi:MAG: NCS1 family nucleobase:cation symporter-1 [Sulfobacillus thermotolerans]|nr:NCS1 family nucleobase:cation symporter-1 [Sulfobacillus thermotolerans]